MTSSLAKWLLGMVGALTAAVLLWPLPGSDRWQMTVDRQLLAGKAAWLSSVRSVEQPLAPRPNVLLIVADDLGRFDLSLFDPQAAATPNIDELANRGISFSNAYATAAICAPSRAALLTGRYQNRFGFESQPMQRYVRNRGEYLGFRYLIDTDAMQPFLLDDYPDAAQRAAQGLPSSELTLGEIFQAAGYDTAIIGKWHLGYSAQNSPRQFGFDFQYGFMEAFSLYANEAVPDVVEFHHDLFWETHIWDMARSGPSAITRDGQVLEENRYLTDAIVAETTGFIDRAQGNDRPFFAYVPFNAPHTPFQARAEDYAAVTSTTDPNERVYRAMIRRLDWAVGELTAHLEKIGELENTLIIFTSDNGGAAYTLATHNGPLRGGKFTQFEGGIEVPLFVRWDGQILPGVDDRPTLLTDLFATLLQVAGLPMPTDRAYDSLSLLDAAGDRSNRSLYWRSDFNRAILAGHWKLLHDKRSGSVLLFDLSSDRGEQRDLSALEAHRVSELMAELDAWEATLAPASWPRVMNYEHSDGLGSYWFAI